MESLMGFRFQPSNEQIFCLLEKKRLNPHFSHHTIKDIDDICSLEPWDLAGASKTESEDRVCYFFCKPYYKYKKSTRAHRRTNAGYWKVTGRGSKIKTRNGLSGTKKILTFKYHGPASKKAKIGWVMHEYHVNDDPSYKLPPDSNSNSFPRNLIGQYTLKYPQLLPNHGLVSPTELLPSDHLISKRNHIEENIIKNQQLHPHHNLIYHFGNQIEQNSPTNPWLPPNSNLISFPGNLIEQLPSDHLISKQTLSEENSLKNLHLQPNHNSISNFGNQIKENSPTNPQLPLNSNLDSQLLLNQPMVLHSSCSFVNYDISDYQINSDQVNDLINSQRAFQCENSRKDTGQTLSPDLNSSKSDGGTSTYAEDSSDTNNTAYMDAWINGLLL
ncbi:protein NTM1-like 9 [Citrus sinensis]|nr:protein NTM1-like 9 [Citrus sinensis]